MNLQFAGILFYVFVQLGVVGSEIDPKKFTLSKNKTHFALGSGVGAGEANMMLIRMSVGIILPSLPTSP